MAANLFRLVRWGLTRGPTELELAARTARPRLQTIAFSHYCELARWALDARGISVSVSPSTHHFEPAARARPSVVRISPSYTNSDSEVDAALAAIAEELARLEKEQRCRL